MPEVARAVLAEANLTAADIDLFVPHQANLRINQFVGQKLGIPESKTVANIEKYGNTTAGRFPLASEVGAWREGARRLPRTFRRIRKRIHLGSQRRHPLSAA